MTFHPFKYVAVFAALTLPLAGCEMNEADREVPPAVEPGDSTFDAPPSEETREPYSPPTEQPVGQPAEPSSEQSLFDEDQPAAGQPGTQEEGADTIEDEDVRELEN